MMAIKKAKESQAIFYFQHNWGKKQNHFKKAIQ